MTNTRLLQPVDEGDGGVGRRNDHEDRKNSTAGDILRLLRLREGLLEADEMKDRRDDERENRKETAAHCVLRQPGQTRQGYPTK